MSYHGQDWNLKLLQTAPLPRRSQMRVVYRAKCAEAFGGRKTFEFSDKMTELRRKGPDPSRSPDVFAADVAFYRDAFGVSLEELADVAGVDLDALETVADGGRVPNVRADAAIREAVAKTIRDDAEAVCSGRGCGGW